MSYRLEVSDLVQGSQIQQQQVDNWHMSLPGEGTDGRVRRSFIAAMHGEEEEEEEESMRDVAGRECNFQGVPYYNVGSNASSADTSPAPPRTPEMFLMDEDTAVPSKQDSAPRQAAPARGLPLESDGSQQWAPQESVLPGRILGAEEEAPLMETSFAFPERPRRVPIVLDTSPSAQ